MSWLGPLISWEMRALPRRRWFFGLRASLALVAAGCITSAVSPVSGILAARGATAFAGTFTNVFGISLLLSIALATPAAFAPSIAGERDRRTLDFLLGAPCSTLQIILGKWLPRWLRGMSMILAVAPVLAFTMFLGGIEFSTILLFVAAAVAVLTSMSAMALAASTWSRTSRRALQISYLLAWALGCGGFAIRAMFKRLAENDLQHLLNPQSLERLLDGPGPLGLTCPDLIAFMVVLERYPAHAGRYCLGFVWTHGLIAVAALSIAAATLRKSSQRCATRAVDKAGPMQQVNRSMKSSKVWNHPLLWHACRSNRGRSWLFLPCWGIIVPAVLSPILNQFLFLELGIKFKFLDTDIVAHLRIVGTLLLGLTYCQIMFRGASGLVRERVQDTLPSLLATPLSAFAFVLARFAGAVKPLVFVVGLLTVAWTGAVLLGALHILALPLLVTASLIYGGFIAMVAVRMGQSRRTRWGAEGASGAICALFLGPGHLLAELAGLRLGEWLPEWILTTSLPWVILVFGCFAPHDAQSVLVPEKVFGGLMSLLFFALLAISLWRRAVRNFDCETGRIEGVALPVSLPSR